ncbi:MAG: HDOD domain-containing protein [Proteobacteria bacterium]|nr:HDOD domain-containing protein [Pseudomonadota bacterium]MBU1639288.1 HDOD domain-containing protein [Pseudomonadota bacterium]
MAATKKNILKAVENIKLLSPNAAGLLEVSSRENHDLKDIVRVIKHDAALTAKTLQLVNSAAFGLHSKISDLERAITYSGENFLISLVMTEAADMIYNCDLAGYEGHKGGLWDHNLLTALASKRIAELSKEPLNTNVAFTAGLLHDLGKAIVSDFLKGSAADLLASLDKGEMDDYASAEEKLLGIDHTQAGYALGLHWNLPEPLPSAMRYHHKPAEAPDEHRALVYAVHLGDMVAMMTGRDTGADALRYQLDSNYSDFIDINENDLAQIILETDSDFSKLKESLNE